MLTINTNNRSVCSGLSRRDLLRVCGAGLFGSSVNQLVASEAVRAAREREEFDASRYDLSVAFSPL